MSIFGFQRSPLPPGAAIPRSFHEKYGNSNGTIFGAHLFKYIKTHSENDNSIKYTNGNGGLRCAYYIIGMSMAAYEVFAEVVNRHYSNFRPGDKEYTVHDFKSQFVEFEDEIDFITYNPNCSLN